MKGGNSSSLGCINFDYALPLLKDEPLALTLSTPAIGTSEHVPI